MRNSFFSFPYSKHSIELRLKEINKAKVGFYSVGLYPVSLAYNCVMQSDVNNLMLAPRPGRELFGAFPSEFLRKMDPRNLDKIEKMSIHGNRQGGNTYNSLPDLINKCDLVILSSNSNHIEEDLLEAIKLREKLNRKEVVIACLVGSFCHDGLSDDSYVLCEKEYNLAFFSGFHRHGALLNPGDSFTANFCHPDVLTAILGAKILNTLSPNIQVSPGVHNLEGQYIKAAKNISSIFAGFGYTCHRENPGILPTLLTLLLDQCLDQAATVSMCRKDREDLYNNQLFPITELGYGVQNIEASLIKDGNMRQVRDHTFSQLTAMVADVRGSMMLPVSGKPTRNFQAGQILADNMLRVQRCPNDIDEFISWCELSGLRKGGLEGIKSLNYWPHIKNNYSIEFHDCSMINLLYMCVLGSIDIKKHVYLVMTESRQLSNFCQESVRPSHSRKIANALSNLEDDESIKLITESLMYEQFDISKPISENKPNNLNENLSYLEVLKYIENQI